MQQAPYSAPYKTGVENANASLLQAELQLLDAKQRSWRLDSQDEGSEGRGEEGRVVFEKWDWERYVWDEKRSLAVEEENLRLSVRLDLGENLRS